MPRFALAPFQVKDVTHFALFISFFFFLIICIWPFYSVQAAVRPHSLCFCFRTREFCFFFNSGLIFIADRALNTFVFCAFFVLSMQTCSYLFIYLFICISPFCFYFSFLLCHYLGDISFLFLVRKISSFQFLYTLFLFFFFHFFPPANKKKPPLTYATVFCAFPPFIHLFPPSNTHKFFFSFLSIFAFFSSFSHNINIHTHTHTHT